MRVAVLDDYQGVAREMAGWSSLGTDCEVTFFRDHLADLDLLVQRLKDFEIVVAMRERTPFPRALLEKLPRLRLLVTTGMRNASVDLAAARERGVVVCGTPGSAGTTGELTWGLILALFRQIPREDRLVREGKWQTTVGLGLAGKTLGIIGLGTIGSQVAKVGAAFNMEVIAWSQNLDAERAGRAKYSRGTRWVSSGRARARRSARACARSGRGGRSPRRSAPGARRARPASLPRGPRARRRGSGSRRSLPC